MGRGVGQAQLGYNVYLRDEQTEISIACALCVLVWISLMTAYLVTAPAGICRGRGVDPSALGVLRFCKPVVSFPGLQILYSGDSNPQIIRV